METKANYVAVGAFVLACVVGLVVTIMWLAGAQYSQEYAYYQTYFKGPVTGLGKGTVTRYNGIDVGRVTDLKFNPNDPQSVIVTMQVQPNLNIREDSRALDREPGLHRWQLCRDQRRYRQITNPDGQGWAGLSTSSSPSNRLCSSWNNQRPEVVAKLNVATVSSG